VTVNALSIHRKYVFNPLYPETFSLPSSYFFPSFSCAMAPTTAASFVLLRNGPDHGGVGDEVEDTSGRGFLAQGAAASW
jgi:hypothetical protein